MDTVCLKLKKIIIKNSRKEITESDITSNSSLTEEFGFESVQIIEMILHIETEFGITIEEEDLDLELLTNFGSLTELISEKLRVNQECKQCL